MGWFTDALQNLDRPSNALQGWITADDWLGLDEIKSGWNLEKNYDIEDAWRAEAQGERGWGYREGFLDHLSYAASVPFNFGLDPINAVGGKMLSAPYNFIKGGAPEAIRGINTTSAPNYIRDFYGPTKESKAWADNIMNQKGLSREMFANNPKLSIEDYRKIRNTLLVVPKGEELVKWGVLGGKNIVKNFNPKNRAIYRETGVNKPMMESPLQSPKAREWYNGKGGVNPVEVELLHRTFANRHIGQQAGRVGNTAGLDAIMSKGFYSGYHVNKPNLYKDLSYKHVSGKQSKSVSDQDYLDIEKHLGVWKDGKGKEFGVSPNDHIIIKKPQSPISGDHWADFQRSPVVTNLAKHFARGKTIPKDPKKLAEYLKKAGADLPNMKVSNDGITFSWSRSGSSITEGGVNFWAKIKPDGNIVGAMSDEHNLWEKLPGMNRAVSNRIVTITPPMTANIRSLKPRQSGYHFQKKPSTPRKQEGWGAMPPEQRMLSLTKSRNPSKASLKLEQKALATRLGGLGLLSRPNASSSSGE